MQACILGMPGCGKSTLVRRLAALPHTRVLHPGRFAIKRGMVSSAFPSRRELLAVPGLTEAMLDEIVRAEDGEILLIEGFPRSPEQARKLLSANLKIIVVHLAFPAGEEAKWSVERQKKRVREDGVEHIVPHRELVEQTQFGLDYDLPAVYELKSGGMQVVDVDAMLPPDAVEAAVLRVLFETNASVQ
jgi:adenylate kinase family enzyme